MLLYGTQPLLPQLSRGLGITPGAASLTVTSGTAAMALLLIPFSLLADRYGRERLMKLGLSGAALFALASALAPEFFSLTAARAALGACTACVPAAAMAYLGEEIAPDARGQAMGWYIGANALGGMAGRFMAAAVTEWLDWRYGLGLLAVIGALAAWGFWRMLPAARHFAPRSLEPRLLFKDVLRIYADPRLPWLFVIAFLIMGSFVGLYNFLGFRLSAAPYGLGPAAIGAVFLLYVTGSVSSPFAGQLTHRMRRSTIILLMGSAMALGLATTWFSDLVVIVLGVAVFTFGYFAAHSVASGWVGALATQRRSLVSALYLSSYYLGGSVIGSATGLAWNAAGWGGVVWSLLLCVIGVLGIAFYLGKRFEEHKAS